MKADLEKIIKILNRIYKIKPRREEPFRVLIGVMLSHRTKDTTSWPASKRLFDKADTPEKILRLSEKEIAKIIYPVGFYNQKAKRIREVCKILLEKYNGKVPRTQEELMEFPGIGMKSSNIVLSYGFGLPYIATDIHVSVISRRWHLTKNTNPDKITEDLHKIIPFKYRLIFNNLLVEFGKEYCRTRLPRCYICPVEKLCPYENKNL